ncbi:MAG: SDR family oxidoreductase [Pseudomonadota bacterium]
MTSNENFKEGAAIIFGATGGIGRHVALSFARAGADVAVVWRSKEEAAASLAENIKKLGRKATTHHCDVLEDGAVDKAMNAARGDHGQLHTMVWGAGPLVEQVYFADLTEAQWRRAIDTEVHGFFRASHHAVRIMREQGGGSIIHLGSAGDMRWPEKDVLSVAPKATNEALIKCVAKEEGRHGIRANSILVGVIEAGMFLELSKQGVFDEAWTEEVHKNLALKRWGQPEEVGDVAVFLASTAAGYVTGQQIAVAGGYGV